MIVHKLGPFTSTIMTLSQWAVIGGRDKVVDFQREIFWCDETHSTVEFRHDDRLLTEGSTFHDWYGFETSIEAAIEEAKAQAKLFGVTDQSSLVLSVRTTRYRIPLIRTERCEKSDLTNLKLRHEFEAIPSGWFTVDAQGAKNALEKIVLDQSETWRSR